MHLSAETFKKGARPFGLYLNGLALAVGLFVPSVTAEKMTIIAMLFGSVSYMRTVEKKSNVADKPA
jgi:hypothetical protein